MSYRDDIKVQIQKLENQIAQDKVRKLELEHELNRLKFIEWEEDLAHERNQQLLKG